MTTSTSEQGKSYRNIFRATSIMGSTSFISMGFNMIRAKIFALVLGPSGTGILTLLTQILTLTNLVSGMGIQSSAVRMIAASSSEKTSAVIVAVRRAAWFTAFGGTIALLILAKPISQLTFGHPNMMATICLLAVAVFLTNISSSPLALLQGMRKLKRLAIVTVAGSATGTVVGIPCVLIFKEHGLVFVLIGLAAASIITAAWAAKDLLPKNIHIEWRETFILWKEIFGLGFSLTATALITTATNYGLSILISNYLGIKQVGIYQSAMTFSVLYINYILGAMSVDYYPQLALLSDKREAWIDLVNRQSEMALAIATPGLMFTLIFSPILIHIFFSNSYMAAANIMRWLLMGAFLQIVSWPLGFVLIAKKHMVWFFLSELLFGISLLLGATLGMHVAGLPGVAIAWGANYLLLTVVLLVGLKILYGFNWSKSYIYLLIISIAGIAATFLLLSLSQKFLTYILSSILALIYLSGALWWLDSRMELSVLHKLKARFFRST